MRVKRKEALEEKARHIPEHWPQMARIRA